MLKRHDATTLTTTGFLNKGNDVIEAEFQDKFIAELRKRHCFVKPLVGNALMAGMPDLYVANVHGWAGMIELKMWKNKRDPFCHDDFIGLLDGPQKYVITVEFWQRNIFCPILALSKIDGARAWIYYGDNIVERWQPWQFYSMELAEKGQSANVAPAGKPLGA